MADQQHGNQGRGSNLSEADRRRGGETSSQEQNRDSQGQYSGTGGASGMGQGSSGMGGSTGMGRGQNEPRDDQGRWTDQPGQKSGHSQGGQSHEGEPRDDQGRWTDQGGQKSGHSQGGQNR